MIVGTWSRLKLMREDVCLWQVTLPLSTSAQSTVGTSFFATAPPCWLTVTMETCWRTVKITDGWDQSATRSQVRIDNYGSEIFKPNSIFLFLKFWNFPCKPIHFYLLALLNTHDFLLMNDCRGQKVFGQ